MRKTVKTNLIRGRMAENGYTIRAFAAELGLHEVTLSEKLHSGKFSVPEATEISKILKFSKDEVTDIFFAEQDT